MRPMRFLLSRSALALLLILPACSSSSKVATGSSGKGGATEIQVFAASSLTDAFTTIGKLFEHQHGGAEVTFNFLSSSDLAAQIQQGAPADVFASADQANMDTLVKAGLTSGKPRVFAHNLLEILVAPGNPHHIRTLQDLEDPNLVLSLCNPECPAGKYSREAFAKAGVRVVPDSEEIDVKSVSTRIETGEADVGVGYASDVHAAGGGIAGVPIPARANVVATYPIAALADSPGLATSFVDLVLSPAGQEQLRKSGFQPK